MQIGARLSLRLLVLLSALALLPLVGAPAEAEPTQGQFVARCPYSHTLSDDPIVVPGQPGASHSHDFFGNVTVDAFSTMETMLAGDTTCRIPSDTAGYWTPTAYLNGVPIQPTVMRVYYLGGAGDVETFPAGLQMVGGNKDAQSFGSNPHVRWSCGETRTIKTPRMRVPYDCTPYAAEHAFVDGVIAIVDFPSCWDGVGLGPDSVAYPVESSCPAGFRHRLPLISERVHYGIMNPIGADGTTVALTLSSGPYWTYHADFWNTWQQDRLDQLVADCLVARAHCGAVDASTRIEWTRQFGTQRYDLAYAADTDGTNAYVAGFTNYALKGQHYHHRYDAFVRKYDGDGNVLWTRQFGSSGTDQALAVFADESGVTVAGTTDGRLPGETHAGGLDAFVARFGSSGRELWVRQFGTRQEDGAAAVSGNAGGIWVAGRTAGALGEGRRGLMDAFVARVLPTGEIEWIRQFGTRRGDQATGLGIHAGVLYAVGSTAGRMGGTYEGGDSDAFVAALGPTGAPRWAAQLGSNRTDQATGIVARANGVYVAGMTGGTLPEQASAGGVDAFVAKVDLHGDPLWHRQFGSPADDDAMAIAADRKGIYVAGSASGALPDGELLGEWDGFARKYLPNGTQLWTRQLGTTDYDRVYGLAADPAGLFMAGTTHGTFDGQVYAGDRDVFVLRLAFS